MRQDVLDWFIRRQRDGWSARDETEFQAWLDADAIHRQRYAQWESHWRAFDGISAADVAQLRRNLERDKVREEDARQNRAHGGVAPQGVSRRSVFAPALAVASLAILVGGAGLVAWNHLQAQPVFAQAFSTQRGQQTEVALPDGSRLRLDTATRLEVTYYRMRREVRLQDGQVVFSVQADTERPFHVLAGPVDVTVVGTKFSVRHTPRLPGSQGVQVAVERGQVLVARRDGASAGLPATVDLTAGQQIEVDSMGALGTVGAVPGDGIAPWRDNRVSFVNTPLVQALAELERYGDTGLAVRDPAIAALRLSGTFDPRDAMTLRRVLPNALPVQLRDAEGVTEIVPAR
ncbi:FecR domain-containing protein [Acidovorax sacchari]